MTTPTPSEIPVTSGPASAQSPSSAFISKLIQPMPQRKNSVFRMMNPEFFIERTAKISPSAWLVTGMVGFAFATIGYTQWEYTQTTKKTVEATARTKAEAKEARKSLIRRQLDLEEGRPTEIVKAPTKANIFKPADNDGR